MLWNHQLIILQHTSVFGCSTLQDPPHPAIAVSQPGNTTDVVQHVPETRQVRHGKPDRRHKITNGTYMYYVFITKSSV